MGRLPNFGPGGGTRARGAAWIHPGGTIDPPACDRNDIKHVTMCIRKWPSAYLEFGDDVEELEDS
jgi:hypothetical protein